MNCIIVDDDDFSRKMIEKFVSMTDFLNLTASYSNAIEAINALNRNKDVDLVFLDIEMPEITGIDFLKSIDKLPQVIVVSSKKEYAFDAFYFDVTDYVLKPVTHARLFKAVNKAYKNHQYSGDNEVTNTGVFVKHNNSFVRIDFNEILWIEALENYTIVNTKDGKYTILYTMKLLLEKLPEKKFIRVHRSYVVNVDHVKIIEDNAVIFKLDKETKVVPVAKTYKNDLMTSINFINR